MFRTVLSEYTSKAVRDRRARACNSRLRGVNLQTLGVHRHTWHVNLGSEGRDRLPFRVTSLPFDVNVQSRR
jgi:hypothetical protein